MTLPKHSLISQVANRAACFALTCLLSLSCQAGELPAAAKLEVQSLLQRLAESGCQFNRNGSWYTAAEAKAHLSRKLDYVIDKKLAISAEEFIAVAASKSSMSGQAYQVKCQSAPAVPSAVWLTTNLKEQRAKSSK